MPVTVVAWTVTVPVVLVLVVFKASAASEVSVKVTASFPKPLIPEDASVSYTHLRAHETG